ncbi:DUF2442 domain-containing protein [Thiospirillum jenense]|uniref:DUF2442 domain-containing protein n=1 Tax=Thiospirillum jenense TaxID=1653858 RepID=A0A839HEL2_9GAMM|nr:DUF2442 domain-containing protein [Thiospirillum jenense]MBB1125617.1 DUF2442 domain-containing protein [Thiospirillum jenense]
MIIKSVIPKPNYQLEITTADERQGIFNVQPYLKAEAFAALKDETVFMRVHNGGYFIEWECGADLSADTLFADIGWLITA